MPRFGEEAVTGAVNAETQVGATGAGVAVVGRSAAANTSAAVIIAIGRSMEPVVVHGAGTPVP